MFDITQILPILQEQIASAWANITENQFASGGIILGIITSIALWLKSFPAWVARKIHRLVSIDIEIRNSDDLFDPVEKWFTEESPCKFSKSFIGSNIDRTVKLLIGMDSKHWFFYGRTFVTIRKSIEKDANLMKEKPLEYIRFTFYTIRKKRVETFFQDIIKKYTEEPVDNITLKHNDGDWWYKLQSMNVNRRNSVVLPGTMYEDLRDEIREFLDKESWYNDMNIPFRRGYLLEGPPGTGKTSLIRQLALEMKMDIHIINDISKLSRSDMLSLFSEIKNKAFVVVEDIDAMLANRASEPNKLFDDEEGNKIKELTTKSFSGILNALDGLVLSEGYIIFMTTNHIEKLDQALIRPGRIDRILKIDNLVGEQAVRLVLKFFPHFCEKKLEKIRKMVDREGVEPMSPAKLQDLLLTKSEDELLDSIEEYYVSKNNG